MTSSMTGNTVCPQRSAIVTEGNIYLVNVVEQSRPWQTALAKTWSYDNRTSASLLLSWVTWAKRVSSIHIRDYTTIMYNTTRMYTNLCYSITEYYWLTSSPLTVRNNKLSTGKSSKAPSWEPPFSGFKHSSVQLEKTEDEEFISRRTCTDDDKLLLGGNTGGTANPYPASNSQCHASCLVYEHLIQLSIQTTRVKTVPS